jgi:hypothetical protein
MPLITRQKVVAIKAEGTPGTAETLAAANGVMNCYNSTFTPDLPVVDRPSQGTYDAPLNSIQSTRAGNIAFDFDILGGAAAPYWFTHVLVPCGFSVSSLTATANGSSNTASATAAIYQDGIRKQIAGAMGNLTIPFTVGEPLQGNVDMRGKYSATTDQTILSPTYLTTDPPRVASATIELGGSALNFQSGTITIENSVVLRPDDTDSTGFLVAAITQQRVTVELDPEATLVATRDDYGDLLSNAVANFVLTVGTSGNQITITIPNCQKIAVTDGDREGIMTHPLTLLHTGSTAMTVVSG